MKPIIAMVLLLAWQLASASADKELPAHDSRHCSPDGIAVGGYDLVAYHTQNQALKGNAQWSIEHGNLVHLFSSEEHLQLFTANPEKYLPKFSGWCATALAKNKLTCPDYENFSVEHGELLLFETYGFTNGKYVWERNPEKNRATAQQNFDRFFDQ